MRYVISRRRLLAAASTAVSLAALDRLATSPAAAAATATTTSGDRLMAEGDDIKEANKIKQADAHYQARPNGQQRCEICLQFLPPGHCRIVQAPVTAQGWCQYFAARDNAT